jgi:hypothetical protein
MIPLMARFPVPQHESRLFTINPKFSPARSRTSMYPLASFVFWGVNETQAPDEA